MAVGSGSTEPPKTWRMSIRPPLSSGWAKTMLGNGTEQSYIDTMRSTGTVWIMVVMLAGTILAAAVSAFIGCKMLKKQFEKAGITK